MIKPAYLAIGEARTPLCTWPLHMHGGCTCDYASLADARRARLVVQSHFTSKVRVISGHCPESLKDSWPDNPELRK